MKKAVGYIIVGILAIVLICCVFLLKSRKSYDKYVNIDQEELFVQHGNITVVYGADDVDMPIIEYLENAGYTGILGRMDITGDSLCSDKILESGVSTYWTLSSDGLEYEIVDVDGAIYIWEAE